MQVNDVPVFGMVEWDPQVEEPTTEPPSGIDEYSATTAAGAVAQQSYNLLLVVKRSGSARIRVSRQSPAAGLRAAR